MLLFFFTLWIILNGRVTPEIILLGILTASAVFLFARSAFGYSLSAERLLFVNLPLAILYFLNLIREIILSAFHVAGIILNPGRHPDPVIIEFDSGLSGSLRNVILANSITLTPGTYTVGLEGDHFTVHCLVPEYADGMGDSSFIRLLKRLRTEQGDA